MGLKIHEYALERLTLGDDDFVDIDYFNGASYESAKIKGQVFKSIVASEPNIVIVLDSSDLPAVLLANTTYVINGEINTSQAISVINEGSCIVGRDRNKDKLIYSGTGAFISVIDVNFMMREVSVSCSNSASSVLDASNIDAAGYNFGRLKTLIFNSCQFRNCYDLFDIKGFDLVDLQNSLFWYCQAQNFGLKFQDVSKLQISSCEIIRWFDESTIPTPGSFASVSMIEFDQNNIASFGAVNINGCVIHPQDAQNGIEINPLATIGFGTISSNTFVDVNLTGELFLPIVSPGVPDYSQTYTNNIDIFTNQGLLNSRAGILMTMNGNTIPTSFGALNTPVLINTGNNNNQTERVRWSGSSGGQATYLGTKEIYVSIHATLNYEKSGGGTNPYQFSIFKNGTKLIPSEIETDATASTGVITMTYATLISVTNYLNFYVEQTSGGLQDITIKDWQIVIRE